MSYTFSRRDFLKYSALTVVAVAGAGMLSGCEIQDPNNPVVAVGKKASIGTTTALLTLADENGTLDGNFKLRIANGADAPLYVNAERFNVAVTYTGENGKEAVFYNSHHRTGDHFRYLPQYPQEWRCHPDDQGRKFLSADDRCLCHDLPVHPPCRAV